MQAKQTPVSSGIPQLDDILGGLHIGDNVVWYDDAGSLATIFCHRFMDTSLQQGKPLIYVSFDHSPRHLVEKLGALTTHPQLTILDCFTFGKGAGADIFMTFYSDATTRLSCRVLRTEHPQEMSHVMGQVYALLNDGRGDVRLVFESLTGMQELWKGEEHISRFYAQSCPRLYELQTIAYWMIEKKAHSPRLRAQINQIAQVAVELSIKRGKTSLMVLKAEHRELERVNQPYSYWAKDHQITFEDDACGGAILGIGRRLKERRIHRNISQTDLARLIGVTPSTISQVESGLITPSLPALHKMAEVLAIGLADFFQQTPVKPPFTVVSAAQAVEIRFPQAPPDQVRIFRLAPLGEHVPTTPYRIELKPGAVFQHEYLGPYADIMVYVLSGQIRGVSHQTEVFLNTGDMLFDNRYTPGQWHNMGTETAYLLWVHRE